MKKILFFLMLVSSSVEAKDIIGDMLRIYAPQPIVPSITPSTYVAPTNTWTPIVSTTPVIDLSPNK